MLTPHRRDGLIEWMKKMLQHSFVLDALGSTGADTFSHFEELISEHREFSADTERKQVSRLIQLVPTIGVFHTQLPLRRAFLAYDKKYRISKRRHVCMSFNEIRQILNLAQVMAICPSNHTPQSSSQIKTLGFTSNFQGKALVGKIVTFDGDQTLYQDGANFESNQKLASYLYLLLVNGGTVAVVTAAGYGYQSEKYEYRLTGLFKFFENKKLSADECERFYIFGGECNYLLQLGDDFKLHAVPERGEGGWMTATESCADSPANWKEEDVEELLDCALLSIQSCVKDLAIKGRVICKKRSIGLVPNNDASISREALDEAVLRVQDDLNQSGQFLPYCAFNGGRDAWIDVGNKRVGVLILQVFLNFKPEECLHIGDQFLNTGNDFAARSCCPCAWITSPEETTYILKTILDLSGIPGSQELDLWEFDDETSPPQKTNIDIRETLRRSTLVATMDVYTGEIITQAKT